jgi:hemerythrin-like metal-binding protein
MINWTKEFSVGIERLDRQHAVLITKINQLEGLMGAHCIDVEHCKKILNELMEYAQVHFAQEESLMKEADYPAYAGHVEKHIEYVSQVSEYLISAIHGEDCVRKILDFLKQWWTGHILCEDKLYGPSVSEYLRDGKTPLSCPDFC